MREFVASAATGENPYGGVVSATRTVQTAIENLATLYAEAIHPPLDGEMIACQGYFIPRPILRAMK
jgi:hypothetical protein